MEAEVSWNMLIASLLMGLLSSRAPRLACEWKSFTNLSKFLLDMEIPGETYLADSVNFDIRNVRCSKYERNLHISLHWFCQEIYKLCS